MGLTPNEEVIPQTETSESIDYAQQKIDAFRKHFEQIRPEIRRILGLEGGEPDTFFVGLFGSTVKNEANEDSDVDGYLYFAASPTARMDMNLGYKLVHGTSEDARIFDTSAQSLFGHPAGTIPPSVDGQEDIEPHDITSLSEIIATNGPLSDSRLKEIAIIFSPVVVGNEAFVQQLRSTILAAINKRVGSPFNMKLLQNKREGWDYLPSEIPKFQNDTYPGLPTWKAIQEQYLSLFKQPLFDLPQE